MIRMKMVVKMVVKTVVKIVVKGRSTWKSRRK